MKPVTGPECSKEGPGNIRVGENLAAAGAAYGRLVGLLFFWLALAAAFWFGAGVSPANSPAAARSILIFPEHVPEEAIYLELLIPMPRDDPYYRSFNQDMGDETGLTQQAPIAGYLDEEGYTSYSFHMENARSEMSLDKGGHEEDSLRSYAFCDSAYAGSETHLEYIQKHFGSIKAALLDGDGRVLTVSEAASIKPGHSGYLTGTITYDCAAGQLRPSFYRGNSVGMVLMMAFFLLIILGSLIGRAVFTAVVESAVSLAFGIRPWPWVFLINFVSNVIFNLLLAVGVSVLQVPYLVFVTAGEITVIWIEFSLYRRFLSSFHRSRLFAFAVTANLVSLSLGIGLNYLLSGMGFSRLTRLL